MKAAVAALIAIAAAWLAWPADEAQMAPVHQEVRKAPVHQDVRKAPVTVGAPPPSAGMQFFSMPPSTAEAAIPAAVSMANTRLHGDPEAPPIVRSSETPIAPSAQELADPKAYLKYEARKKTRVYAAYIRAVDQELPILRDDIARGRAIGIAPEKIAKAEEKARRLEAMRAQLLKDHPELQTPNEES